MYLQHFNLQEHPFRLTPDPRFLHLAEPHRAALLGMLRSVCQRSGFMVMTGPVGTGKTTLLHAGLKLLSDKIFPAKSLASAFIVNPTLSQNEFLELVVEEFEINANAPTKPGRLLALQQLCLEMNRRRGTAVLIIDEAHLLSRPLLDEIRLLGNLETHSEKILQIVLCGQPELADTLATPEMSALRQRISTWCKLRPLSLSETRAYMAQRLHAAGARTQMFTAPAIEEVFVYSMGIPRLVNQICDRSLISGFEAQRRTIEPDIIEQAALALDLVKSVPVIERREATSDRTDGRSALQVVVRSFGTDASPRSQA